MVNTDEIYFAEESESVNAAHNSWKVMIVDDEHDIHKVTLIALHNFIYKGKGLFFINAYSAKDAEVLLKENSDIALILLDVVMEEDNSGLKLIKYIRNQLNNQNVRIILRTGQAGLVPERDVILNYDINDYKEKRDFTSERLFSSIVSSLRAYEGLLKIENANVLLNNLLDSFIKSTASALDEKSQYTTGHIRRVAELTCMIAEALSASNSEKWADFNLSKQEHDELRIAAWMHDIGKITTPEHIVDKATKLETIYDRIKVIKLRAEILKKEFMIELLNDKMQLLEDAQTPINLDRLKKIEDEYAKKIKILDDDVEFLIKSNNGVEFMEDSKIDKVKEIAHRKININGQHRPFLEDDEVYNLSIKSGTLTAQERDIIQNHAKLTIKMLSQLTWPDHLKRVTEFAGAHHETLSGKGYPNKLKEQDLSIQSRIIALADVFEALTAADRPYKKGKTMVEVSKILEFMIKDRHLDKDIVDFFVESGLAIVYAKKELKEDQLHDFIYNGVKYALA